MARGRAASIALAPKAHRIFIQPSHTHFLGSSATPNFNNITHGVGVGVLLAGIVPEILLYRKVITLVTVDGTQGVQVVTLPIFCAMVRTESSVVIMGSR